MAQPSHREQLVKGAIKCLQTKGYARTTTRDIAAASGANLASIGYHFGSKEALLNEAMIRLFARRNWRVGEKTLADGDASAVEHLRAMFAAVGELFGGPRPLFMALFDGLVLQWLLEPGAIPSGEQLIDALVRTMTLALEQSATPARAQAGNAAGRRPAPR